MRIRLHTIVIFVLALNALGQQPRGSRHDENPSTQEGEQDGRIAVTLAEVNTDAVIGDPDGKRFLQEIENQLQASDNFYWWGGNAARLTKKSLEILVASVEVEDSAGVTIGSAIVLLTSRVSDKDKEARRQVDVRTCFIRRGEPVDGFVRQYFDEIRDKI